MKYISCELPNHFALKEKEEPTIAQGQVLLKVKRIGICGTDLHAFKGNQPFFSYPRILGHEVAAEVLAVNGDEGQFRRGDSVVVIPYLSCGKCSACSVGKTNCCETLQVIGVHTDGGMQEIISLPENLLIKANDLSLEEIAIVEPLAIGAHALRRAETKNTETIIVMGCGPIGMGIVQLGKHIGATVIAMDTNEFRLALAKEKFGADHVINPLHAPIDKVKEITKGTLVHTVFDATGNKVAIERGLQYMRHGGKMILVGLFKGDLSFNHPSLHAKETTLMSSRNATREDFEFVVDVLRQKKFNTEAYITKRVKFTSILTDFDTWSSPDSKEIKVVTVWDSI
jgi:2-desacetyl-2-hydroxyethyl bacteriochlorophyllide A dehydrogenase